MLRVFSLAAGLMLAVAAVVVVVFGGVVIAAGTAVVLFVASGTAVPGAAVEPAVVKLPLAGVVDVVGAAAGSVVSGVGSGGNGLDITPAIRSVRPTSDWL